MNPRLTSHGEERQENTTGKCSKHECFKSWWEGVEARLKGEDHNGIIKDDRQLVDVKISYLFSISLTSIVLVQYKW